MPATATMVDSPAAKTDGERNRLQGKRVLFILPTLGVGGAERQAFLLARELQRNEGASVRIVSVSPPDIPLQLIELCEKEGLSWDRFTLRHTYGQRLLQLWDLIRFTRFLRRERPDVLLPYCMFPNIVSALTWRLGGARLCVWNQRDEGRNRVMRFVERIAVGRINCFISNSEHGAAFLTGELGVTTSRVQVIGNGVELREAQGDRESWRRRLRIPADAFVACMVANLHGFKDHRTLIDAWTRVVTAVEATGRDAHLLLAGSHGDRADEVRRQIEAHGLQQRIHLLGTVNDIGGLLRAIDLSVFSSVKEGLPNAVLEAMSAGVAVVATDYPGVREALGPGVEDFLAEPKDAEDLARKIIRVAMDDELRLHAVRHGQRRVATTFSVSRMSNLTVEVLLKELHRLA
jgi:glycosyltransferase involved in cell wall biosynthesis